MDDNFRKILSAIFKFIYAGLSLLVVVFPIMIGYFIFTGKTDQASNLLNNLLTGFNSLSALMPAILIILALSMCVFIYKVLTGQTDEGTQRIYEDMAVSGKKLKEEHENNRSWKFVGVLSIFFVIAIVCIIFMFSEIDFYNIPDLIACTVFAFIIIIAMALVIRFYMPRDK